MIKRCIFFFYFGFLLITWCWINTFKRCYRCALHSPLLAFWEHSLPVDWQGLRPTNLQSQNAPELAPQIHTVYSRTQLSMVPFWFSNLHKKPTVTVHIMFIILVSAYGMFLFYYDSICTRIFFSFFSLREWNWQMTKCIFLANAQEHKCTSATEFWGKKIYRTWLLCCKFLSSICP